MSVEGLMKAAAHSEQNRSDGRGAALVEGAALRIERKLRSIAEIRQRFEETEACQSDSGPPAYRNK